MGVTADKSLDWVLVSNDPAQEFSTETETGEKTLQARKHYRIERTRRHIGVSAFNEEVGRYSATFQLVTGPSSSMNYSGNAGKQYLCTVDRLQIVDLKAGEALQTQVWEYFSEWETIDMTTFQSSGGGVPP